VGPQGCWGVPSERTHLFRVRCCSNTKRSTQDPAPPAPPASVTRSVVFRFPPDWHFCFVPGLFGFLLKSGGPARDPSAAQRRLASERGRTLTPSRGGPPAPIAGMRMRKQRGRAREARRTQAGSEDSATCASDDLCSPTSSSTVRDRAGRMALPATGAFRNGGFSGMAVSAMAAASAKRRHHGGFRNGSHGLPQTTGEPGASHQQPHGP